MWAFVILLSIKDRYMGKKYKEKKIDDKGSASVLLNILKNEYDTDRNRKTSIENRTSGALAFIVALLLYSVGDAKIIDKIVMWCSKSGDSMYQIMVFFVGVVFSIVAVYFLVKVLTPVDYKTLDVDEGMLQCVNLPIYKLKKDVCEYYIKVIRYNRINIEQMTEYYSKGLMYLQFSVAMIIFCKFIICLGGM